MMRNNDIVKYLKQVQEVELSLYSLNKTYNGVKRRKQIETSKDYKYLEDVIDISEVKKEWNKKVFLYALYGFLIGLGIFIFYKFCIWAKHTLMFWVAWSVGSNTTEEMFVKSLMIIFPIIGAVLAIFWRWDELRKGKKANKKKTKYNNSATEYNKKMELQKNAIANSYDIELNKINSMYNETKMILQQYYNKDIIYKKYRNLLAVTAFIEYFESGRCNTFTGPHGAYNLYEQDYKMGLIINRLDTVIDKLDDILECQRQILGTLNAMDRSVQRLVKNSIKIENNTGQLIEMQEMQNYYAEQNANNIRYLNTLETFKYLEGK